MKEGVSIIIAARNEAANLKENLPLILAQEYPDFEVIVVNDRSSDNTGEVLADWSHRRLRVIDVKELPSGKTGKKNALSIGIAAAKNNFLLFTDADCKPATTAWIQIMTSKLENNDLVLGVSQYSNDGGLLNEFIQYDTLVTAAQYLTLARIGMPYMGVGRNMAYRKEVFEQNQGFTEHFHVEGGDDDLFVGEVARIARVELCVESEAQTISKPESSWRKFYAQKRRHLSVGLLYRFKTKFILALFQQTMLWSCLLLWVSLPWYSVDSNPFIAGFVIIRVFALSFLGYIRNTLNFKIKWFLFPIYDFLYVIYFLVTGVSVILVKKNKWN